MAVNRVPVLKRCRSLGLEPGYLGVDKKSNRELKRANRKMSEYGSQLREKQKAKFIYGVLEKPFRNYYDKADRMKGQTGENLMVMLESRLDNVVFRMGFARTIFAARQYVAHGHFTVNGVRSFSPSRLIKAGDVVAVREQSKEHVQIKEAIASAAAAPEYLSVDLGKMQGTLVKLPLRDQIPVKLEEQLVVEYYSR